MQHLLRRIVAQPESRAIVGAVGFGSSLIALYQFLGPWAGGIGTVLVLAYYVTGAIRQSRRMREVEHRLLAELPHQHGFLVEFLRQTYKFPSARVIADRNSGLVIHAYRNEFIVRGTDCANVQHISGSNVSEVPARGVSFALVGGSSLATSDLGARYSVGGGPFRNPEFIQDEDRFKLAFCEFPSPLETSGTFELTYTDDWKGAMRISADGFFFPEALYFPSGVHRLSTKVDFSFPVASVAVLEVDVDAAVVRTHRTQPRPTKPSDGMSSAFAWFVDSPPASTVYVLYYRSARNGPVRPQL
ncbi:MAG: hypothetical protein DDT30_01348 [Dehalococcoidia bacterium]|nr:hypothetical protein [Bacillota bacterium]